MGIPPYVYPEQGQPTLLSPDKPFMPFGGTYLSLTWANDGLNYLVPASGQAHGRLFHDDDGFTNDLIACAARPSGGEGWEFCARHRMITERLGLNRIDEVIAEGKLNRTRRVDPQKRWTVFLAGGLIATGPLGGAPFQDAFHRLIHWGRRLDRTGRDHLQDQYEGGIQMGPRLRVGGRLDFRGGEGMGLWAGGEVAVSPEVGTSQGQVDLGISREWALGRGVLSLIGQLSLRYLQAEEERLTFPGAYPAQKAFCETRGGISYRQGSRSLGFSLVLNVEGSASHQGVLSVSQALGSYRRGIIPGHP